LGIKEFGLGPGIGGFFKGGGIPSLIVGDKKGGVWTKFGGFGGAKKGFF